MYTVADPVSGPVRVRIRANRPGSPGASSAFVSAFVARLMAQPRPPDPGLRWKVGYDNLEWAVAAIHARKAQERSIPDSMPTREAIDRGLDMS